MTASILPNAKTQFFDANGTPLALGSVYFYVAPNTTTFKDTWQDSGATIANVNPVPLDAAGEALIWGSGLYRQLVKDAAGNTIWDQITSDPGYALANSFSGTSTTSITIGTGAKTFTTQAGLSFFTGQRLIISSNANSANYMFGAVTSYNTSTGALVMSITAVGGSGTLTDWNISISGPPGITGPVSTTGSPASGNLTKFSSATAITNGNLSGDVTTTNTLTTTVAAINGVTVSGTTGTGNVMFSASPTFTGTMDCGAFTGIDNADFATGAAIRTATSAGNTLLIQARDVDGASFTTFITLTANNTPACAIQSSSVTNCTINNSSIGLSTPAAGTFTAAIANSFVPNLSTIPTNGMYLPAANTVGIAVNGGPAARFKDATGGVPANYFTFGGSPSGAGAIEVYAEGADTDIIMAFASKGAAGFDFYSAAGGNKQFGITHTASADNWISATGADTGSSPRFSALGSDTNIDFSYYSKGSGNHIFYGGATPGVLFGISTTSAPVNQISVVPGGVGVSPAVTATGTDSNLNLVLTPKNTGVIKVGNSGSFTANGTATVTVSNLGPAGIATATIKKWLTIQDNAGTVLYIPAWGA